MSSGYESEPVRGLPGHLPAGEHIIWQGAPDWKRLALTVFHVRIVGGYFVLLAAWAVISGSGVAGILTTLAAGFACVALLCLFSWMVARSTVYTLTNRRIVLRMGVALPKCINLPLAVIGNASLKRHPDGSADIPLELIGPNRMGYAMLWPHARPWKLSTPEPMLRAVPEGEAVAALLARTLAEAVPEGRRYGVASDAQVAGAGKAVAA